MPKGAASWASAIEKPPTAHFALWYAASPAVPMRPPSEETWTMWVPLRAKDGGEPSS